MNIYKTMIEEEIPEIHIPIPHYLGTKLLYVFEKWASIDFDCVPGTSLRDLCINLRGDGKNILIFISPNIDLIKKFDMKKPPPTTYKLSLVSSETKSLVEQWYNLIAQVYQFMRKIKFSYGYSGGDEIDRLFTPFKYDVDIIEYKFIYMYYSGKKAFAEGIIRKQYNSIHEYAKRVYPFQGQIKIYLTTLSKKSDILALYYKDFYNASIEMSDLMLTYITILKRYIFHVDCILDFNGILIKKDVSDSVKITTRRKIENKKVVAKSLVCIINEIRVLWLQEKKKIKAMVKSFKECELAYKPLTRVTPLVTTKESPSSEPIIPPISIDELGHKVMDDVLHTFQTESNTYYDEMMRFVQPPIEEGVEEDSSRPDKVKEPSDKDIITIEL